MFECDLRDYTYYHCPDALFNLSSMLYKKADKLSVSERIRILPVVEKVIHSYEDTPSASNVLRSLRRFLEEELVPFVELSVSERFNGDDENTFEEHSYFQEQVQLTRYPLRKGSPLRFDTLSILTEVSDDSDVFYDETTDVPATSTDDELYNTSAEHQRSNSSIVELPDIDRSSTVAAKPKRSSLKRALSKLARRFTRGIRNKFCSS